MGVVPSRQQIITHKNTQRLITSLGENAPGVFGEVKQDMDKLMVNVTPYGTFMIKIRVLIFGIIALSFFYASYKLWTNADVPEYNFSAIQKAQHKFYAKVSIVFGLVMVMATYLTYRLSHSAYYAQMAGIHSLSGLSKGE